MEDSQVPEGTARELRTEQKDALTKLIAQAPEGYARQRVMRAIARLVKPELRVSILQGTLLWPGGEVSSCAAARAGGSYSRSPYKDAWSRLDPQEYGFRKFGALWKHLVDEYLVNATPSLGPVCSAFVGSLTGPPCRREPETKDAAKGAEVQKRR